MPDAPNIALVRRVYDSRMAPEVTSEIIAPDLIFDVTPGFPGGVYHGWDSVSRDFFGGIMPMYDSFYAGAEEFYADDHDHRVRPLPRHAERQGGGAGALHPPVDDPGRQARAYAAGRRQLRPATGAGGLR